MRAVNLIPAQQRGGTSVGAGRSEGGAYAVIALVGGLAVMAFMYGSARHEISHDQSKATSINAQVQQTKAAAQQLAPYTSFLALREQRTQAVTTLVDTRFDWAHVFHEFARVLPLSVSITSLTGTVGATGSTSPSSSSSSSSSASASSVASATPPGSVPTFTITGCATSQQEVARMITRLRLMDGVADVTLQSSVKSSAAAGGSSTSSTGCPPTAPVFAAQVAFDPLPPPPATPAGSKTVSVSATSVTAPSTTSGAVTP